MAAILKASLSAVKSARMAAHMVRCSSIVASRAGDNEPVSETDAVGVGVSLAALVDGFAGGGFQVIG